MNTSSFKFGSQQVESIINKVVPLIAAEKDHEFFKGVLHCKAESCGSSEEFSSFIAKLLKK